MVAAATLRFMPSAPRPASSRFSVPLSHSFGDPAPAGGGGEVEADLLWALVTVRADLWFGTACGPSRRLRNARYLVALGGEADMPAAGHMSRMTRSVRCR